MTVSPGTKLGPYEILAPVGAGGMGEVFRGRDTRLDRTVAIKILPQHLSSNPDLKQRFEREARTISSLSHPHICALYDIGHQDGIDYLVMEFVEGETLADRLNKGALPIDQVLRYGMQIADALNKAHHQGIVHRDLKPGNIMITKSGVKLLDFGLAKLNAPPQQLVSGISALPTEQRDLTAEGTIIGTLQYMSPEQLEGRETDGRTDIFAMGLVLYEMATGRKAFTGKSQASLIAAILSLEPAPISTIQPLSPPAFDRVVKTCLAKDPEDRWQTAHDVMLELKWIAEGTAAVEARPQKRIRRLRLWQVVSALLLLTSLLFLILWLKKGADQKVLKFSLLLPENTERGGFAISPDGSSVAFSAGSGEKYPLWIRRLDSFDSQLLPGTENCFSPFWSPDGRFIGFFDNSGLRKIDVSGGPPQTLYSPSGVRGGTWSQNGVILFTLSFTSPIYQISSGGGEVKAVTYLDSTRGETSHRWPYFLPDGRHFLYLIRGTKPENRGIYIGSLDSKEKQRLLPDDSKVQYSPDGYIFFERENNLVAQRFDPTKLQLSGDSFPVAEKIGYDMPSANADFSVSKNMISFAHVNLVKSQLRLVDRTGKQTQAFGEAALCGEPYLSPDEKKVALACHDPVKPGAIQILDLSHGMFTRITSVGEEVMAPVWSPDGGKIIFSCARQGYISLYEKDLNGTEIEKPLGLSQPNIFTDDWSSDGRYLLLETTVQTKSQLFVLPLFGERKLTPLLQSNSNEEGARFSPDAKWVVYASDESGRFEVYVRKFPVKSGEKWQISNGGGDEPSWQQDGKELFYVSPDNKFMAVDINTASGFESGVPKALFEMRIAQSGDRNHYVPTSDGQHFLLNTAVSEHVPTPIQVLLNWTSTFNK